MSGGDEHVVDGTAEGGDGEIAEIGEHFVALSALEDEHVFVLRLSEDTAGVGGSDEHDVLADIPSQEALLADEIAEIVGEIAAFCIDEFAVVRERVDVDGRRAVPFGGEVVVFVEGVEELVSLCVERIGIFNAEDGFEVLAEFLCIFG